jgi:bifunctional non-homologous end joining protein LigD
MLATAGTPADARRWVAEPKWDGYRVLITTGPAGLRVETRRGRVVTACLPELSGLNDHMGGRPAVFDGELLAYRDDQLDFYALSSRLAAHSQRAINAAQQAAPIVAMLFDTLWLDDTALIHQGWRTRRAALESVAATGPAWQTTPVYPYDHTVLDVCERHGLEGIVAKHIESPYRPGARTRR